MGRHPKPFATSGHQAVEAPESCVRFRARRGHSVVVRELGGLSASRYSYQSQGVDTITLSGAVIPAVDRLSRDTTDLLVIARDMLAISGRPGAH
jgi:hypothetical protein